MGFPQWTLVGMGLSGLGAVIFTLLTFLALSPETQSRLRLGRWNISSRIRDFVGFNLACWFLAVGFFLAGVPLGGQAVAETAVLIITATPSPPTATGLPTIEATDDLADLLQLDTQSETIDTNGTVESVTSGDSGAFGGPPAGDTPEAGGEPPTATSGNVLQVDENENENENVNENENEEETAVPSNTPRPTLTPTITPTPLPTGTPTVTPTPTPLPTQTVVPPLGETAVIETGGNTLWVRRTPGGTTLSLLENGASIILADGIANWEGGIWRQVYTLDGTLGWIQDEFIVKE
jgi:hypothetical protein